jgi:hypothetical protein
VTGGCSTAGGVVGVSVMPPIEIDILARGRDPNAPFDGILTAASAISGLCVPLTSSRDLFPPLKTDSWFCSLFKTSPLPTSCSTPTLTSDSFRLLGLDGFGLLRDKGMAGTTRSEGARFRLVVCCNGSDELSEGMVSNDVRMYGLSSRPSVWGRACVAPGGLVQIQPNDSWSAATQSPTLRQ